MAAVQVETVVFHPNGSDVVGFDERESYGTLGDDKVLVTLPDGSLEEFIGANGSRTSYVVTDAGTLRVNGNGEIYREYSASGWATVEGTRAPSPRRGAGLIA